jgi:hypothetical protein
MNENADDNVSGNAADPENSFTVDANNRNQGAKPRVIDSAKAMSVLRTLMIIAGLFLLLLFIVWLKK